MVCFGSGPQSPGFQYNYAWYGRARYVGSRQRKAGRRREGNMPKLNGEVFYDSTRTVFTIPVELEPNTDYTVGLNAVNALAFQDEKGNPLRR